METDGRPFGGKCIAAECIKKGSLEAFKKMKEALIEEFNALKLSNGQTVK